MKNIFLLLILFAAKISFAQAPAQQLEEAVKIYNKLRDFEDSLQPGSVTQTHIDRMKADIARAQPLLDNVKSAGSSEEAKVARYFSTNFQYELGFVYGMMGRNKDAYETLQKVEADYEFFSSAQFPMSYSYEGKTYKITYENFAPTLAEYYTGMSEITANLSKNEEALKWARRSLGFSYTTDWYKYIAAGKILDVKKKRGEWDKEMLDCSVLQLEMLAKLDTSYQRTIKENNYATAEFGYKRIRETLEKDPALARGEEHRGKAAPFLAKLNETQKALEFYEKAIAGGYADDHDYFFEAAGLARKNGNTTLAIAAADKLSSQIRELECAYLARLAQLYNELGEKKKADDVSKRETACYRKKGRNERRDDRNLRLYAGFYPGPLLTLYGRYRDYGAVLNVMTNRFAIESSYKLINRNRLFPGDVTNKDVDLGNWVGYWDGFRAHAAVKFFFGNTRFSDGKTYVGPLFEYMVRDLEPIYANVYDANNYFVRYKTFYAQDKCYSLLFNQGMTAVTSKGFTIDLFAGFGASYVQFDGGGEEYNSDAYVIDHPLLENRKPTRISLLVRAGLTMGFSLGGR